MALLPLAHINLGRVSGVGKAEAKLFIERLCSDWDNTPSGMRKAVSVKDAQALHQCCGLFQHFAWKLGEVLPGGEIKAAREKLNAHFLLDGMDAELSTVAETSVPPGDLKCLGPFRRAVKLVCCNVAGR